MLSEIDKLVTSGILTDAPDYTEFQSPIFVIHNKNKPNNVQVVMDFRAVNEIVQDVKFPLPSIDLMILQSLSNMKYFSRFDCKNSFHLLEVDERDSHILTVITDSTKKCIEDFRKV